ncbi:T9SS type A sorting domain-containing protein [Ignavibacterium sp.]|jgi:photosystem II stability/assembly factor-like uncharacterized protein|uniref:T9SS type A sorting domain-containing protein n=2 Tax=Ignavibacterium TaxID=795750 RepID=UPI0025BADADF|nr:T9SS type A sorting domain-containing protein [Ignavibacterium sp.]
MRNLFFYFVISLIISSTYSQSRWNWISPEPPVKRVYSSVLVDGKAFLWCEDNCVIKLDTRTERFEMMPVYAKQNNSALGDFTEQGIAFVDSMVGYITDITKGEFRTTDGGKSWSIKSTPGSTSYLVTFGSKSRGWKLGYNGFFITNNAGLSWTLTPIPPFFGGYGYFSKIFALNENQVWVLRNFHYSGNEGSIYYSSNAGYYWRKLNTGLISDSLHQVRYTDIKINPSGIGFAIGNITKPDSNIVFSFIQRTTDMGTTWSTFEFRDGIYKNIISISDSEWIFLGHNPGFYYTENTVIQRKTSDLGNTWSYSEPLSDYQGNSFFYSSLFANENQTIYMFTSLGFFKSEDKGETYQRFTSERDIFLSNVVFDSKPINADSQLGVAYKQWYGNKYLLTTNGGYAWQQKSLPNEFDYIWRVGIAENVIYMIIGQTRIIKSTDLGETWIQLTPPVYYIGFQALSVYNKDIISFAAYINLVSSTDGGNSWIMGPVLSNVFFTSTDIISPGYIFGAGAYYSNSTDQGFLFNSSDYGLSWHIIDYENRVEKIQMLNETTGYALSRNKLLKTTDSGKSWKPVLEAYENFVLDNFVFLDSIKGIVNENDKFHATINGGATWGRNYLSMPISTMSDMTFNAKGDLFVIGKGAMVMIPFGSGPIPGSKENSENLTNLDFNLFQNYPNPFNPSTKIRFNIPDVGSELAQTTLKVYDVLGNEVAILVNEEKPSGRYEIEFDASSLTSGVYFYRLQSGSFIETKKMILLR